MFAKCGKGVNVEHGADIGSGKRIEIGDNSGIGVNCVVKKAIIGKDVMMGPEVVFVSSNHRFDDLTKPMRLQGNIKTDATEVGDDVWIGTRVIILPSTKIGKGVIIGAGAVVIRDIPDYAIVAGNPAKVIRFRNEKVDGVEVKKE